MQFTRFIFRTEAGRGVFFSEESGGEICFVWICGRGLAPFRSLCRVREAALYRIKTMRTRNILRQLNYKRFRKQKPTKKRNPRSEFSERGFVQGSIPGSIDGENLAVRSSNLEYALLGDKLGRAGRPDELAIAFAGFPVSQLQGDDPNLSLIHI